MTKSSMTKLMLSAGLSLSLAAGMQMPAFAEAVTESAEQTTVFASGTGSEEDPWVIDSVDTFLAFAQSVNDGSMGGYAGSYILLDADLDLEGVDWVPIGNMDDMETFSTMFLGSFDGGGHTISNLTYETEDFVCGAGLFGISCGSIENLNMTNVTVNCLEEYSLAIGGVIGYNMYGTVSDITVTDSFVTGNNCTGIIIGGSQFGTISGCTVEDSVVTMIGDNDFSDGALVQVDIAEVGGLIVGGSFGGTIDNCTASGTVTATGNEPVGMGGIGGCLEMMDSVTNCTADVVIESAQGGHAIGGLCGYAGTHSDPEVSMEEFGYLLNNYPGIIDNCSVNVEIRTEGATHVGGLVGTGLYYYGEETAFAITNCSVTGSIDGAVTPGAIAGRAEGSTIEACTYDVTIDGEAAGDDQIVGTTDRMYESADQYESEEVESELTAE